MIDTKSLRNAVEAGITCGALVLGGYTIALKKKHKELIAENERLRNDNINLNFEIAADTLSHLDFTEW